MCKQSQNRAFMQLTTYTLKKVLSVITPTRIQSEGKCLKQ